MGDFFGSSKDKPTVTTTNNAPWDKAQPHLENLMNKSTGLFNDKVGGVKPWAGKVQAPLHGWQAQGLSRTRHLATQPNHGLNAAQGMTTGLMQNNGMTPGLNRVAGMAEEFAGSADGMTGGQRNAAGYLDTFARGDYTEDPRLASAIAAREARGLNSAATMFGGGRYGSAAIGRGVGDSLAEAGNELMLTSNENARSRQLQAGGMLGDLYSTGAGQKLQATGLLGDLHEGGRTAGLAAAGLLPTLEGVKYYGADQLTRAGQTYTDRAQVEQDAKIKRFEDTQQGNLQWDQIAKLTAALAGMGKVGDTKTQVAQPPKRSGLEKTMDLVGLLGRFL